MFKITTDTSSKYAHKSREEWLDLAGDWIDEAPKPNITSFYGAMIWDDSVTGIGTKGRWGDLLVKTMESDHLVYVQPRVGWAGVSLAALAKKYNKKLTLFMPSSKVVSDHQLVCIERGANPIFRRIAAMPVLNKYAKDWAEQNNAQFVPFGLDHPLVVAAGVKSTIQQWGNINEPKDVVSVISTGVLTRTLQIAWPNATFHGIAVARNLHPGEIGRADVTTYHKAFREKADYADEINKDIDSAPTYDCKGLERFMLDKTTAPKSLETLVWNVAGDVKPVTMVHSQIDSFREWGEFR
jgi:hypothetical protein